MDKKIAKILENETQRQSKTIELIAAENFVSQDILKLQGIIFINKYAEGYLNNYYYGDAKNILLKRFNNAY